MKNNLHTIFMQRCLELAQNGAGYVSPNPLVGAVIVHQGKIIGEGWHKKYGTAHAEVNAAHAVNDKSLLPESTLYVNLEPCSHHGKTPPCADLILKHQIKKVVIGMQDPNPLVAGKGVKLLQANGVEVIENVLLASCLDLNRKFITFITQKRHYILLKWAQSADGFIGSINGKTKISGEISNAYTHKLRAEYDGILVGFQTALQDNPRLDTRNWVGKNPKIIIIDRELKLPSHLEIFKSNAEIVVFNTIKNDKINNVNCIKYKPLSAWEDILDSLYELNIGSVMVEGGSKTLNSIIKKEIWDEACVISNAQNLYEGIKAPIFDITSSETKYWDNDRVDFFRKK